MNLNIFRWRSLKTRVTLFTLTIFVMGIWSLAFYTSRILREDMQGLLGEQQFSTASFLAAEVNDHLYDRLRALEKTAGRVTPALLGNAAALQTFLEQRLVLEGMFNGGIFATGLDGTAIADTLSSSGRIGANYIDRDHIASALGEGKATIGRPLMGRMLRAPIVAMAAPIRDTRGKVIGALAGVTNLGMPNFLDKITQGRYGKTGSYLLLVAPQHRLVVTSSDKRRIMEALPDPGVNPLIDRFVQGYEGSGVFVNPVGVEVLASVKSIPVAGWLVAVALPTEEVFAPIHAMQQRMLVATIFLTLLAGVLSWWMLKRQLAPMLAAAKALAALSNSNQPPQRLPITSRDEIGDLIKGFNRLLETLAQREEALLESNRSLWESQKIAGLGSYVLDIPTGIWKSSDVFDKVFGIDPAYERSVAGWEALIHPDERAMMVDYFRSEVLGRGQAFDKTYRIIRHDDQAERWVHGLGKLEFDAQGRPLKMHGTIQDITERRQAEVALRESEARFRCLTEMSSDFYWETDAEHRLTQRTESKREAAESVFRQASSIGKRRWEVSYLSPDESGWQAHRATLDAHLPFRDFEISRLRANGAEHHISVSGDPVFDASGEFKGYRGVGTDITERKRAEAALRNSEARFRGLTELSSDWYWEQDDRFRFVDASIGLRERTGSDEHLGKTRWELPSTGVSEERWAKHRADLEAHRPFRNFEYAMRQHNGGIMHVSTSGVPIFDERGIFKGYRGAGTDITALKEHEKQLEHIAHYDALTGLPNRVLLADRLHQAIAQAHRHAQPLAVAYLDLDGFKAINDRHGHDAGDQLLMTMATRMKHALREGDTLSRLGGDEFVAVLLDLADVEASVPMLARLLAASAQPVQVGDLVLQVSASLGVTYYPQAEDVDADQLLRQADQAMYQAKLAGKNRYHVFDAAQDRSVRGHHESLEHIRRALTEREFVLHYQPKVNMRTGTVIGAEALIRWQHPERGLLPPAVFLPVIEDHPLAVELGEWVIDTALTQMSLWHAAGLDIPVSVNVGARQLQQAGFSERLREILAAHPNVRPGDLELEILETSALEDVAGVSRIIEACQEIGVVFAMDDFGTGYSSLTYLKRLPVTLLKIDQSFVRDMLDDPDDLAILEGVIGLATAFHRQVIAEGVETVRHGEMLLQLGCDLAQGFGIARPMPARELSGWSAAWRPDPAWICRRPVSRDNLPLLFASIKHHA